MLTLSEKQQINYQLNQFTQETGVPVFLHFAHRCRDPYVAAKKVFKKMRLSHSRERNAILVYIAVTSKQFAVLGDSSIHEKVGDDFWQTCCQQLGAAFKQAQYSAGFEQLLAAFSQQLLKKS